MTLYQTSTKNRLGERIGEMTATKFETRMDDGIYYSVKTGVLDYLGDEIILTVFPEKKLVTDEGYTGFSLETDRRAINIQDAQLLIDSHGATLTDTYYQHIQMKYEDDWEKTVKKLTSCIVDVYEVLTK